MIDDRFVVDRFVGSGAMGAVWRAFDQEANMAPVAIKVLKRGIVETKRFIREAEVLASLHHPNIVRYITHGHDQQERLYLALEWLDGEDLACRLDSSTVSVAEALTLCLMVAYGLGEAHKKGIIHRDIKPSNIFLVNKDLGAPKILDFGVARYANHALSITGTMLGTPWYMAPEQALAESAVDARADIYSLGCVLFECLAFRPPFPDDNPMVVFAKILQEEPPLLRSLCPDLSPAIENLVHNMLSKKKEERPYDGSAVAKILRTIRSELDTSRQHSHL